MFPYIYNYLFLIITRMTVFLYLCNAFYIQNIILVQSSSALRMDAILVSMGGKPRARVRNGVTGFSAISSSWPDPSLFIPRGSDEMTGKLNFRCNHMTEYFTNLIPF